MGEKETRMTEAEFSAILSVFGSGLLFRKGCGASCATTFFSGFSFWSIGNALHCLTSLLVRFILDGLLLRPPLLEASGSIRSSLPENPARSHAPCGNPGFLPYPPRTELPPTCAGNPDESNGVKTDPPITQPIVPAKEKYETCAGNSPREEISLGRPRVPHNQRSRVKAYRTRLKIAIVRGETRNQPLPGGTRARKRKFSVVPMGSALRRKQPAMSTFAYLSWGPLPLGGKSVQSRFAFPFGGSGSGAQAAVQRTSSGKVNISPFARCPPASLSNARHPLAFFGERRRCRRRILITTGAPLLVNALMLDAVPSPKLTSFIVIHGNLIRRIHFACCPPLGEITRKTPPLPHSCSLGMRLSFKNGEKTSSPVPWGSRPYTRSCYPLVKSHS